MWPFKFKYIHLAFLQFTEIKQNYSYYGMKMGWERKKCGKFLNCDMLTFFCLWNSKCGPHISLSLTCPFYRVRQICQGLKASVLRNPFLVIFFGLYSVMKLLKVPGRIGVRAIPEVEGFIDVGSNISHVRLQEIIEKLLTRKTASKNTEGSHYSV